MSPSPTYSLADVLAVAQIHPFYCSTQYPPDDKTIQDAREKAASKYERPDLKSWPLLRKADLYTVIERLINDTDARNTYRHNVYTSVTGGGGGVSKPLFFATDALENRRHRALFGDFLKKTGIIERGDWVLSTHHGGSLYSAEAGPYGASSPFLVDFDPCSNHNDFVIDTRMTIIEVLPLSSAESESDEIPKVLSDGETGVIAQTALTRLRHPVIRYITGDIGSLHPLPQKSVGRLAKHDVPHCRILRLQGRDHRFSFMWDGCDFQFDKLNTILSDPQSGVLLWQVILDKMQPSQEISLEIRLLSGQSSGDTAHFQTLLDRLKACLDVNDSNEHKFKVTFVNDALGFELSGTGRKVIRFVDRSL
ncbi:uncharacterized protein FPRO_06644 [Fusarium proliferatum ET1]|uniref:Uncharacterized protein n=1 Tax=Fusarium proliferatum (strain ET1) TaxID=1227346 RepID=A0A1L7VFE4_FUSPR|nr:uncharacterized protein FPRO_06644 [Fusarium proliferatum ET1]CZR38165.1 uncharacterized protein FPRO_06644 [Fusarium proliferatum ET1]